MQETIPAPLPEVTALALLLARAALVAARLERPMYLWRGPSGWINSPAPAAEDAMLIVYPDGLVLPCCERCAPASEPGTPWYEVYRARVTR